MGILFYRWHNYQVKKSEKHKLYKKFKWIGQINSRNSSVSIGSEECNWLLSTYLSVDVKEFASLVIYRTIEADGADGAGGLP